MDTFFVLLFKTLSYICYCQGENMKISLPVYSKGEEVINSMTHGVVAVLSLIGTFIVTNLTKEKISLISGLIFCISLFLLYTASAIYHGLPKSSKIKRIMRVIDHCNVFILEAGTFTPVCLIALSDKIGIVYFYIIWLITIIGIIINIIDVDKYENISLILHLIMGWSVLFAFNKLLRSLNIEELRYLFGGGLFYTVGSFLYYIGSTKKYMHSIFHIFCLLGSYYHFLLVYSLLK